MTTSTGSLTYTSGNPDRPYDDVDLSSREFWARNAGEREESFAVLRESPMITWHRPFEDQLLADPGDYGFWAITRHEDLVAVTRNHHDFLSGPGTTMENLPQAFLDNAQSIIAIDPPRHMTLRKLISAAFTPKRMRRIDDQIKCNARLAVDNLLAKAGANGGRADFVSECAALMPMNNINDMMDVPQGEREEAAHHTMVAMSWNDPEVAGTTKEEMVGALIRGVEYCHRLAIRLAGERRGKPGPDASHGLMALTEFPEQREWLLEDLPGRVEGAVEESLRWATPIMTFRRTACRDVEFRCTSISSSACRARSGAWTHED